MAIVIGPCCTNFCSQKLKIEKFFHKKKKWNEFLFTKIEAEDIGNIWFQQDGTTCHTAEAILDVLCPVFEDRMS